MHVLAVSTPSKPDWRWRIVDYAGDTVEESSQTYGSIATAVTDGTLRMVEMNVRDVSERTFTYARSTSYSRHR